MDVLLAATKFLSRTLTRSAGQDVKCVAFSLESTCLERHAQLKKTGLAHLTLQL